jgi:nucleotide-binding universal stress UspA family protein
MMRSAPKARSVTGMSAPILAAFCPRDADRAPVEFAAAASRATGDPLVVISVHPADRAALDALADDLAGAEIRVVEHGSPAREIARAVETMGPQLLVLGSTHRSSHGRVLPGSTAERLIAGSPCPVAVVPRGFAIPAGGMRTVAAAYAPTPEGRAALGAAARMARAFGARLRVVRVLDPRHAEEQSPGLMAHEHHDVDAAEGPASRARLAARAELDAAVATVADGLEAEVDVLYQDVADGLDAASQVVDLLVMGSRAHGPVRAVGLGGVSRTVIARAACPVLVLPRGSEEVAGALLGAAEHSG